MIRLLSAVVAALSIAACAPAAPPTVTATDAWCRAAPAAAMSGGCYLNLQASADDRLVSVSSDAAADVEIHTMSMTDGIMRMRELPDGLALPRGRSVSLRPGAEHLMLIRPTEPLTSGRTIRLTLTFTNAPPVTVEAPVRVPTAAAAHGSH